MKRGMGRGFGERTSQHLRTESYEALLRREGGGAGWASVTAQRLRILKQCKASSRLWMKSPLKKAKALGHQLIDAEKVGKTEERVGADEIELYLDAVEEGEEEPKVC